MWIERVHLDNYDISKQIASIRLTIQSSEGETLKPIIGRKDVQLSSSRRGQQRREQRRIVALNDESSSSLDCSGLTSPMAIMDRGWTWNGGCYDRVHVDT